jgi:tRNA A-37 threonylcarbamoyl transferase component Bud32
MLGREGKRMTVALDDDLLAGLRRMALLREEQTAYGEPLTGGVSSDIWRVDLPSGPICIKRALAKLKVAADWRAPVDRNVYEARWMQVAAAAAPGATPRLLGQDAESGSLAMEYLPAERYALWKARLRDGVADPDFAARVAGRLVAIHAASAADPSVAGRFPTDRIFYDIRLEPYLVHTGRQHPDLAPQLEALVDRTWATKKALVHGDVSPKNILCGPDGPVFLDAECAWWGDPAFDLAFCLNHLLLKCLWTPFAQDGFLACFQAMASGYLAGVNWEPPEELESRAAALLPGLFLARVDGKSPVEYITSDRDRAPVRRVGRRLLAEPVANLAAIADIWRRELTGTDR